MNRLQRLSRRLVRDESARSRKTGGTGASNSEPVSRKPDPAPATTPRPGER